MIQMSRGSALVFKVVIVLAVIVLFGLFWPSRVCQNPQEGQRIVPSPVLRPRPTPFPTPMPTAQPTPTPLPQDKHLTTRPNYGPGATPQDLIKTYFAEHYRVKTQQVLIQKKSGRFARYFARNIAADSADAVVEHRHDGWWLVAVEHCATAEQFPELPKELF